MKLFPTIVIALISINALAQSSSKTVTELLEKTGTTAQIRQMDATFSSKIEERKKSFTNPEDFNKFSSIMKSGLNAKNAEFYFMEYFKLKTNEDSLRKIITMYNNPMLQEFNKIELEANSPAKQPEQAAFFQKLSSNPPSQERIKLLVKLNNETGASEMTLNIIKNLIVSMARGANQFQPKEKQISEVELRNKINTELPADFSQQLTNQLVAVSLFTYQSITDQKLEQYIKIWETPLGRYLIQHTFGAYDYAFSKMGEKAGSSFKELDKSKAKN